MYSTQKYSKYWLLGKEWCINFEMKNIRIYFSKKFLIFIHINYAYQKKKKKSLLPSQFPHLGKLPSLSPSLSHGPENIFHNFSQFLINIANLIFYIVPVSRHHSRIVLIHPCFLHMSCHHIELLFLHSIYLQVKFQCLIFCSLMQRQEV